MPFKPRIVEADESAFEDDFALEAELANLGDLLGQQAQALAEHYPAEDETAAVFAEAEPSQRRSWLPPLSRVAAVVAVCLTTYFLTRPQLPEGAPQPATPSATPTTSASVLHGMQFRDLQIAPIRPVVWEPPAEDTLKRSMMKCGTGPESDGMLDLLENSDQATVLISM